jgi:hypothetical protein
MRFGLEWTKNCVHQIADYRANQLIRRMPDVMKLVEKGELDKPAKPKKHTKGRSPESMEV